MKIWPGSSPPRCWRDAKIRSRTRSSIVALTNSKPCIRRRAPINASGFGDALHGGRLPFIAENADRRARQRPLSAAGAPAARARQTDGVPAGAGGDARLACRYQRLARPQQPQRHLDRHRNRQQGLHPQHAVHPLATLYGGADRRADPAEPRHYPTLWYPAAGRGGAQRYRAAAQAGSRPAVPWRQLAQAGIGAWPDERDVQRLLAGRDRHAPVPMVPLLESWRVTAMRSTRHGMRGSSAMWWRRFRCTSGPTMCAASRMQRVKRLSMRCW